MKKNSLLIALLISIFTASFAYGNSTAAGELTHIKDVVIPDGDHGHITTTVLGVTDGQGRLALPYYQDTEMIDIQGVNSLLVGEPELIEEGDLKYYMMQFREKQAPVALVMTQRQNGTFEIANAKLSGDTFPGNVKRVNYQMINRIPIEINQYVLEVAVPEGYEIFSIVDYDPEEPYLLFSRDGLRYASFDYGSLSMGETAQFSINLFQTGGIFKGSVWGAVGLISVAFLYQNKGMLNKAKELSGQKKVNQGNQEMNR